MGKRTDRNKNSGGNFRFIILLIFFSMLAIFIGFQIGNSFFASRMDTEQEEMEIYESASDVEEVPDEEPVVEDELVETDPSEDNSSQDSNQTQDDEVEIEDAESESSKFLIQVGAFGQEANAQQLQNDLESRGYNVIIHGGDPYRVRVEGGNSRDEAEKKASELQGLGLETLILSE
ncbi:MAG: SPOR domain-containing protein [Bacillota bacterium]